MINGSEILALGVKNGPEVGEALRHAQQWEKEGCLKDFIEQEIKLRFCTVRTYYETPISHACNASSQKDISKKKVQEHATNTQSNNEVLEAGIDGATIGNTD